MAVPKYNANTKYDKNKEAVMTELYRDGKFVMAVAGYMTTDELVAHYVQRSREASEHNN